MFVDSDQLLGLVGAGSVGRAGRALVISCDRREAALPSRVVSCRVLSSPVHALEGVQAVS